MSIFDNMRIAVRAMVRRPVRTVLTLQGVVWAAAIIVFPSAIEKGSVNNAIRNATKFKTDEITVRAFERSSAEGLTLSDVGAVEAALAGRNSSVTPFRTSSGEVFVASEIVKTTVVGTDETAPKTRSFYKSTGRYLTAEDVREMRRVCVLEALAAEELFPKGSPLDKRVVVRFADRLLTLQVVGVMRKRDAEELATDESGFRREESGDGSRRGFRMKYLRQLVNKLKYMLGIPAEETAWKRTEKCVHVPLSLLPRKDDLVDWLIVKTDPLKILDTARTVQKALVSRNKEPILLYNIFLPILLSDQLQVKHDLTTALFILCLIMGGIVVSNIMLMSVMERNREIAIRRVEGASKKDIVWQFLIEGATLCVAGALMGIPVGLGLAYVTSLFEPYAMVGVGIPLKDMLIAVGAATLIGTTAAILPARRAANLDPVVVLQSE